MVQSLKIVIKERTGLAISELRKGIAFLNPFLFREYA